MAFARRGRASDLVTPTRVPTLPVEVDWQHPLANGLVACYVPGGSRGAVDLCDIGPRLAPGSVAAKIGPTSYGPGLVSNATNSYLSSSITPAAWKLTTAGTIFTALELTGTPSANATLFGLLYNSTVTTPYNDYILNVDASNHLGFSYNHGGNSAGVSSAVSLTTGRHTAAATFVTVNGQPIVIYANGAAAYSTAWNGTSISYAGGGAITIGGEPVYGTRILNGNTAISLIYNRALSAAEIALLDRDPFVMLRPIRRTVLGALTAGALSVFPGAGSIIVTGFAPTNTFGAFAVAPGVGSVVVTGFAPTNTFGAFAVAPGVGSVVVTGFAPTVSFGAFAVAPGAGSVVVTGFAPTATFGGFSVAPSVGSIVTTGFAPTVSFGAFSVTPGVGSILVTGFAPTNTFGAFSVAPGVGSIIVTGLAPTVTPGAFSVMPGVGSVLITGFIPGVDMGIPAASTATGAPPPGDGANVVLSGTLTSATQSPFFEFFGPFNVSAWGTFSGTVSLERSFDGGVTWLVPIYAATSAATFTAPVSFSMNECELGVLYRFDCTIYTSGTINYRISTTGRMARSEAN